MIRLARFLILRPLLTNIILVLVLLLAASSFWNIRRQAYPRVDFGKLNIVTIYPGASPEDVELNVTINLEEAIREVSGIDHYISRSTENYSFIQVVIDPDVEDQDEVKDQIRNAIDRVSDLPAEVEERPIVEEIKMDRQPIYEIALTMQEPDDELLNFHARQLKKKLLDIPEVSVIDEVGMRDREIQILLDREHMARYQVSFDDVIRAIKYNKIRVSGGSLESYTHETGIVTLSEFESPQDVANIIIRANPGGNRVRIRDVGRVQDSFEKQEIVVKFRG
ncbi:MAG: efflux RND transporter permease subunit, partial [Leptospiraceae bacterium]|nr:efflux RND transporter permease subunit [Leptospiraceae bacterium]